MSGIKDAKTVTVGDKEGGLVNATDMEKGEQLAAIMAFLWQGLEPTGENVGLGALADLIIRGEEATLAMTTSGELLVAIEFDAKAPKKTVENALDNVKGG